MSYTDAEILHMFDRSDMSMYQSAGGVKGFAKHLEVDLSTGLSEEEEKENYSTRISKYGLNVLPNPPTDSWCKMFLETFKDLMLQILIGSAILSVILITVFEERVFENYIETISIFVAVLLVAVVQAQTNYAQQQSFIEINKLKNSFEVTVLRQGREKQIKSTEVLKGDILCLKSGDAIAADALYISGQDLKVNNSAQTGESDAIPIHEKMPFLLGGSAVETGFGNALVVSIGAKSRSGDMMMKIQDLDSEKKEDLSPLQQKLEKVALLLTWIGLGGATVTFIVLLGYWISDMVNAGSGDARKKLLPELVDKIMTSITIFVCAVPEGLPLAVTLSLGFSMKKMMADQNFVRHLSSCETMGGATTICSDKTGTLTLNQMSVVRFYQIGSKPQVKQADVDDKTKTLWSTAIAVNSNAYKTTITETKKVGKETQEITKTIFVGSASECALLQLLEPWGKDYEKIRKEADVIYVHEFNSARKKMSTIVREKDSLRAYIKGGPDFCLPLCTHYIDKNGEKKEMSEEIKKEIFASLDEFAEDSLRTMLLGYRDLHDQKMKEEWKDPNTVEKDITIIGIVGIQDPLRPEVKQAVANCRRAGVIVRMVTGDYIKTAKAIAKECGILDESLGETAIEGKDFAALDKLKMLELCPNLRVMARSSPMDKLKLVAFLMEMGEVVAATGDGSNDSPALKQADVGLSMGKCGTELAKMASDIVILDDNFNSIVSALKWGRCVYDNVRGFLQFQLTVNFCAMFVAFVGAIALHDSPLKTIQLLWVNLIMDSFGALALATRGPSESLLLRPPYGRGDKLINNVLMRNIVSQVLYQVFVLLLVLFGYKSVFGLEYTNMVDGVPVSSYSDTVREEYERKVISGLVFNTFVFLQVFNLPNSRLAGQDMSFFEGLFTNIYFVTIFFGIIVVQFLIIQFGEKIFDFIKQTTLQWVLAVCFGFGAIPVGFIVRLFRMPDHTSDNLNALREDRRNKIKQYYTGMSYDEQFKNRINNEGKLVSIAEESDAKEESGKK